MTHPALDFHYRSLSKQAIDVDAVCTGDHWPGVANVAESLRIIRLHGALQDQTQVVSARLDQLINNI